MKRSEIVYELSKRDTETQSEHILKACLMYFVVEL